MEKAEREAQERARREAEVRRSLLSVLNSRKRETG